MAGAPPINNNIAAIATIQRVQEYNFPPTDVNRAGLLVLARRAAAGTNIGDWPNVNASRDVVGRWCVEAMNILHAACNEEDRAHVMFDACVAQTPEQVAALVANVRPMGPILTSIVRKFITSADRYAANREESCRRQMANDGFTEDQIDAFVTDAMAVRTYVQEHRTALMADLEATRQKVAAADPMNMPTHKEMQLYERHERWFVNGVEDLDEFLPNDNAVPYPLLIYEILWNIARTGPDDVPGLVNAADTFFTMALGAFSRESNNRAWATLGTVPNHVVAGFNVGQVMRDYVSFGPRSTKSLKSVADPKLQTATQRGPRRLLRMCAVIRGGPSQFTILNLPLHQAARQIVDLNAREVAAAAAIAAATNIAPGAAGLSDSESIAWLMLLGRTSLFEMAIGRNDLSLPALCGAVAGIPTTAFGNLEAREWALDEDL